MEHFRFLTDFDWVNALPSILMVLAWLGVLRSVRYSGWGIAFISLIGTALHEAAHWVVGFILCAKPVSVSLFPKRQGDTWQLGSVGFTNLNIWNSAPVAFAPLLLVGVAGLVFAAWMQPAFLAGSYVSWALAGYVTACSLFACWPSSTDFKIGALSGLMYGAIGYGLWRLGQS